MSESYEELMPKAKPYTGPVEESVARQLLNSTGHSVDINGQELLLGDALLAAAEQLKQLVEQSNQHLEGNEFAKIVAEHLANDLNKRGGAEIAVTDSGQVQLYVGHKGNPRSARQKPKRKRKVPLMAELKERAAKLGVEIPKEFGIKRSKITEWLTQVEKGEVKVKGKTTKPVETADDPPETDPGPMSAGPDETKVSAPLDETSLPKKRGFVKTSEGVSRPVVVRGDSGEESAKSSSSGTKESKSASETPSRGKNKSLRQLVDESKEVDISTLLASDPPK